eukprot:TRINITY_DN27336_c0_g1_i1.p1 TRINITY_DN27336_c0_g1~~TRINITY_DN27336_c0_g1_i1.p1  ORF type:complete len:866 (+),score=173.63 TRINITY_DN27336_c0_g1_i1:72-2600(+)
MFKGTKKPTAADMCGPAVLRSSLVSGHVPADVELDECELIGQGAYGMVHRVQEKETGLSKVLKSVVRPHGWDDERLKMEAQILQNLDHPHILRIFSWYEEADCINIVMEHCDGGELLKVIRDGKKKGFPLPERWAALAIRQSFQAMVYIHSKGVVHKDLKGQNLLLLHDTTQTGKAFAQKPHVVVCDLGIAEICSRGIFGLRGSKVAGTPATMAPEVWSGSCGPKSDVWSMGCVMFEMFTNRLPFEVRGSVDAAAKQQARWVALHQKGPNWDLMRCSQEPKNLCKQLLTFREGVRPVATEVLAHPWLNQEVEELTAKEVEDLCKAVMSWRDRSPCQRAFCLKVAANCTCIDKFATIFSKFDTDHSGILDTPEVVSALVSMGISKDLAKKTAKALDVNGDKSCEYLEFTAACILSLEDQFDELLRQEFRALDVRRAGSLREKDMDPLLNELKSLAATRGLQLEELDADGDGSIDFQEFCAYFGRPNVTYSRAGGNKKSAEPKKSSMPMKQHVRIMNNKNQSVEMSMEQLRQSMEHRSMEAKQQDKAEAPESNLSENSKAVLQLEEQCDEKKPKQKNTGTRPPKSSKSDSASTRAAEQLARKSAAAAKPRSESPSPKSLSKSSSGKVVRRRRSGSIANVGSPISIDSAGSSAKGSQASSSRSKGIGSKAERSSLDDNSSRSRSAVSNQDSERDTVLWDGDHDSDFNEYGSVFKSREKTGSTTPGLTLKSATVKDPGGQGEQLLSSWEVRKPDSVAVTMNSLLSSSRARLRVPPSSGNTSGMQRTGEADTMYVSLSAASLMSAEGPAASCAGCFTTSVFGTGLTMQRWPESMPNTEPGYSWIVSL